MAFERADFSGTAIQSMGIVDQTDPEGPKVSAIQSMGLGGGQSVTLTQSSAPKIESPGLSNNILPAPSAPITPGGR